MFDTHYDLLTIAYQAYVTGDYTYLENISKFFHENNVNGVNIKKTKSRTIMLFVFAFLPNCLGLFFCWLSDPRITLG